MIAFDTNFEEGVGLFVWFVMSSRKKGSELQEMQIGSDTQDLLRPRARAPLIVRYPPPKTTIVAFLLFIVGLFFLCFGVSVFFSHIMSHGQDRGIAMIVLGGLSK